MLSDAWRVARVKPRQKLRHQRREADCSVERGARSEEERALDHKVVDPRRQANNPLREKPSGGGAGGESAGGGSASGAGDRSVREGGKGAAGESASGGSTGGGAGTRGQSGKGTAAASPAGEGTAGGSAGNEGADGDVADVGPGTARKCRDPAVRRVANGASAEDQKREPGDAHGRTAAYPKEIPGRAWRDIFMRVWENIGRDNTSLVAAGIGLNALLAVFPALAVLVSVYGMFAYPGDVARDLGPFLSILPGDASKLLTDQLQTLTTPKNHTLGFGAVIATIVALWNSRQGMSALMTATNIAYNQREQRGFFRQTALSIGFSVGAMFIFLVMLLVGVAVPLVLQAVPIGAVVTAAVLIFRWVLLWSFAVLGFSLAYRYAPDRQRPKWRWVTWGSAIAATVWILGSLGFAAYVQNFGSYGKTYGALGGVIVLLMWFYLMGFTIVLGAEINAEMEHQTAVDTTEGPPAPMGERGAYVADTLGRVSK
jgi:membrane protein